MALTGTLLWHAAWPVRPARTTRRPAPAVQLACLICVTLGVRLLFAAALGLGIDESYMVAAGRNIHLGYFDHPPIAWWLAWASAHVTGSDAAFAVRLPFVLLFALSTWLMFRLGTDLFGARAGLWAAILLNAAPVLGVTAGSWVLPDGPLIAALLAMAVCFVRALSATDRAAWGWWLGAGACAGLAMASKYTAILTLAGLALYLLTAPADRRWLARPQPYAAAGVALALFAPVLAWNAAHGWASLLFQGGRVSDGRWHPLGPLATLGGEALFFLPWIWLPLAVCLCRAARRGPADQRRWLLLCLAMPPILAFEVLSLHSHVLFHWTAPGTMLALPLLAEAIVRVCGARRIIRVGALLTAAFVTLGATLIGSEVRFNWLPDVVENFAPGYDPDLDAVDWGSLRTALRVGGRLRPGVVVAAIRWHDAGKIDYELAGQVPVICLGNDPREYGLIAPVAAQYGADVLIVAPRATLASIMASFAGAFDSIAPLPPIELLHAGRSAMTVPLFLGHRLHAAAAGS